MTRDQWTTMVLSSFAIGSFAVTSISAGPLTNQMWSVQDSAEARYFIEPPPNNDRSDVFQFFPVRPILPSPDGRKFAAVMRSGDLETDSIVSELRIYDTEEVTADVENARSCTKPTWKIVRKSRSTVLSAVAMLEWSADGRWLPPTYFHTLQCRKLGTR